MTEPPTGCRRQLRPIREIRRFLRLPRGARAHHTDSSALYGSRSDGSSFSDHPFGSEPIVRNLFHAFGVDTMFGTPVFDPLTDPGAWRDAARGERDDRTRLRWQFES